MEDDLNTSVPVRVSTFAFGPICEGHNIWMSPNTYSILIVPHIIGGVVDLHGLVKVDPIIVYVQLGSFLVAIRASSICVFCETSNEVVAKLRHEVLDESHVLEQSNSHTRALTSNAGSSLRILSHTARSSLLRQYVEI